LALEPGFGPGAPQIVKDALPHTIAARKFANCNGLVNAAP
jgi:hypothetical protein